MSQVLIGRQFQAGLDLGSFEELIVTATHHKRQSAPVGQDGSCAILPVEAQQHPFFRVVMGLSIALNDRDSPTQFGSVFPIAGVSKGSQTLMRMRWSHGGPAPHNFPSLASGVARRTEGTQATLWRRPIRRLRQRPLTRRFPRPINIEDEPAVPLPIPQPSCVLLCGKAASQQIFQKERPQGFDRFCGQRGSKAAER
jgi:hypothetical protein